MNVQRGAYTADTDLLFPEASVDDATTQVVHPLPLNDVIQDELPACWGTQLTWRERGKHKERDHFAIHSFCK